MPQFKNDCPRCKFIGTYSFHGIDYRYHPSEYDVYVCNKFCSSLPADSFLNVFDEKNIILTRKNDFDFNFISKYNSVKYLYELNKRSYYEAFSKAIKNKIIDKVSADIFSEVK